uniref:C1q and TNF related 9 n=1 Tax=Petromyzon marinus TaxID=7757 RepID=S4RT33_PETMA
MGLPGIQGNPGIPGNPGNLGPVGPTGSNGRELKQGQPGKNGEREDRGDHGVKGDKGGAGEAGTKKNPALPLAPFPDIAKSRLPGKIGPMGPARERGDRGLQREKGDKGEVPAAIPRSAFTVGLSVSNPPSGSPIRFSKVMYNEQNHYDTLTDRFTCHFPGIYYFSYHITGASGTTQVSLRHNRQAVQNTYSVYSLSGASVLCLRKGDEVWVQTEGAHIKAYTDVTTDSTFSGFLMYPGL